ncbi:RHS repeat domain-containing protein [Kutzneria buriramensis]|uniref:YD repeat-containing protein n=1 Tax=Kutzneria buriramensis TaxID=1045776 RepID=A0A3E0HKF6_9PSEU|nr:RHS repeat domain-containing protein [Kutzneria buriramensis]REH46953.1 YD repeat-containing protein [Kutzneria buriramensis]
MTHADSTTQISDYNPDGTLADTIDGLGAKTSYGYTGNSMWTYDTFGETTAQTQGSGASVGYGYDNGGNLTSITYPGQTPPVQRGYDDAERLHSVTVWNNNQTVFGYDADSQVRATQYPNGTTVISLVWRCRADV